MSLHDTVRAHGQEHVLKYYDQLEPAQQQQLDRQLAGIAWDRLDSWLDTYVRQRPETHVPDDLTPPEVMPAAPTAALAAEYAACERRGRELLAAGKVAAFTVAGGQGTRLGYDGPKGSFPVGPITGKSLFQIFAESLRRWGEKAGRPVPWYLMTSETNDAPTRAFFAANDYFGLDPANVTFFVQGMMPAFAPDGKLLLAARDSLAMSPDGHGGSLKALHDSGALADMAKRGVEIVSYFQVDNPIISTVSPLFIGMHDRHGSDMSSRSLTKREPFEKLGLFCHTGGVLKVIEYSDLPDDLAVATEASGALRFSAGSPAIHVISRAFVERLNEGGLKLPFHRADKKVPYLDAAGNRVEPTEANAVKLEMFIFDALPLAGKTLILEADRADEFAPVKNATGEDSPATARAAMQERWARWLAARGVHLPRAADGSLALSLEISPASYVDPEDFQSADLGLYSFTAGGSVYIQ